MMLPFVLCFLSSYAHAYGFVDWEETQGQAHVDSDQLVLIQTNTAIVQAPDVEIKYNRTHHVLHRGWMALHGSGHGTSGSALARRQNAGDHQQMDTRVYRHALHNVSWYYRDFANLHVQNLSYQNLSEGDLPLDEHGGLSITGKSNFEDGDYGKQGTILFLPGQSTTIEAYERMWDEGLVRMPSDTQYKFVFLQTPRTDKVHDKWPWFEQQTPAHIPETITFVAFILQSLSDERGDGKLWLMGKSQGAFIALCLIFRRPDVALEGVFSIGPFWSDDGIGELPARATQPKVWLYSGSLDIRTPPFGVAGASLSNYSIPTQPPEYSELLNASDDLVGNFPRIRCKLKRLQWSSGNYRFLIKPGYGHSLLAYGLPKAPPTVSPSSDGSEFDALFDAMSGTSGKSDNTEDVTATVYSGSC